jgi:hypothetical protein
VRFRQKREIAPRYVDKEEHGPAASQVEKRDYKVLLRPLISGGLISYVLWKVGPSSIAGAFASSRWGYILFAASLSVVFVALKVLRWSFLLRSSGRRCGPGDCARSYLGGMSVAIVTPGRVGELARAFFTPFEDKTSVLALALADKILDMTCILGFASLGAFRVLGPSAGVPVMALSSALIISLFRPSLFRVVLKPLRPRTGLISRVERSVEAVASIRPRHMFVAISMAMATLTLAIFQFHLILSSFDSQPFMTSATVMPMLVFANFVPFVMSGIGAREALSIVLFRSHGVDAAAAVNTALLLFIFDTASPAVVGTFVAGRRTAGRREE